jgi:hypothetical protein
MSKDLDSKVKLGHGKLASSIVRRLERHYEKDADLGVENSLVVGIFGEWGSGKSTLLNEIGTQFRRRSLDYALDPNHTITIPVRFNPWRYEKEAHLIVPLLKVTQATIRRWVRLLPESDEINAAKKKNKTKQSLKRLAQLFGVSALSMASMVKAKAKLPGIGELELSGKDAVDQAKSLLEIIKSDGNNENCFAVQELESHYYEFESQLQSITRPELNEGEVSEKLNLLFLIDDLDRCLPEKAVEMLESIKLFLDVPGCAFAIALDDEVVERGIQHRYRDYIFEQHRNGNGNNGDHAPPITGAEYLEKIIQLPFRLPLPTKPQLKALLKSRYPELFADIQVKRIDKDFERGEEQRNVHNTAGDMIETKESSLLGFLVDVVPPVPRKLIRSAELIELTKSLAKERQVDHLNELALARYILLQLFAPQLYRYARNHYKRIFQKLKEWKEEFPDDWRRDDFSEELGKALSHNKEEGRLIIENVTNADRSNFERSERKILKMLYEIRNNRVGFDPTNLLTTGEGYRDTLNSEKYFSLVDDMVILSSNVVLSNDSRRVSESPSPLPVFYQESFTGEIEIDAPEFMDQLFGRQESSWRSALTRDELQGKQLATNTYEVILNRLKGEYKSFAVNIEWLTGLSEYLSFEQLRLIYKETKLLETLKVKGTFNEL